MEAGLSLHHAVYRFPLRAAEALLPAYAERHGSGRDGPSAVESRIIAARKRARAFLEANYTIST